MKYLDEPLVIGVSFLDHSDERGNHLGALPTKAWGLLVAEDTAYLYLAHWLPEGEIRGDESYYHAIAKCTLLEPYRVFGKDLPAATPELLSFCLGK